MWQKAQDVIDTHKLLLVQQPPAPLDDDPNVLEEEAIVNSWHRREQKRKDKNKGVESTT